MSGQLLLINPRKRTRRAGGKHRTAAQKAATRRLVAMNRARRRNPTSAVSKRRRARNPAPRAIHSRVMHRRRRNPLPASDRSLRFTSAGLMASAKHAGVAAGGAVAVDYAFGFVKSYLPASMQTPVDGAGAMNPLYFIGKGLFAVLLGVVGSKAIGRKTAAAMAEGSLTVTAYTALRGLLPATISAGLGYYQPAVTDTPGLPGSLNFAQPGVRGSQGTITDMRAYLSARGDPSRSTGRAYDNPGMSAYLSRR